MSNRRRRTVVITDNGFDPAGIPAVAGQDVLVEFVNRSQRTHRIEIDLPGGPVRLHQTLPPGKRTFVRFAPDQPGVTRFRSTADARLHGALVFEHPGIAGI